MPLLAQNDMDERGGVCSQRISGLKKISRQDWNKSSKSLTHKQLFHESMQLQTLTDGMSIVNVKTQ